MRFFLFITFQLWALFSMTQVVFDKTKYDFGDLEAYDDRVIDFVLTNKGQKKEYVLSVNKPYEVIYIVNGKFMDQDSSIVLRLQVNPKAKGRFSYDVDVFVSDRSEPVKVKLSGNLKELPQNEMSSFTACPDFNTRPGGKQNNEFQLTVVTIDKVDKTELQNSNVTLIQNGTPVWTKVTDKNGKIKEDATLGLSYFYATHEGYIPTELGAYINFQRNYIVLELTKDPAYNPPVAVEIPPIEPPLIIETEVVPPILITDLENEETTDFIKDVPVELTSLDPNDFSESHFAPVNVVFVLDVSSSMSQGEKMELMKYSLFQLTDMLRAGDKMGIVTYSDDSRVLLAPTSGSNKEEIKEQVEALKASGMTAGGEGIKLGYKQALKSFIPGGVNQIIVITDGAFNRNSDDYTKHVKKYKNKGIQMSVVGIKIKDVDKLKMEETATLGGGRLVPIMKLADAQNNLKQEIRFATFKN